MSSLSSSQHVRARTSHLITKVTSQLPHKTLTLLCQGSNYARRAGISFLAPSKNKLEEKRSALRSSGEAVSRALPLIAAAHSNATMARAVGSGRQDSAMAACRSRSRPSRAASDAEKEKVELPIASTSADCVAERRKTHRLELEVRGGCGPAPIVVNKAHWQGNEKRSEKPLMRPMIESKRIRCGSAAC
eukprot:4898277-Pleurochrysis_carterae.AAC.3